MAEDFTDGVKRTVLIIDDEADFRMAMEALLSEYGYEVLLAESGREGLEKIKEFDPQVVFLDMNMPGMDGIEVLTEIRQQPDNRTLPVIMLTGQGDSSLIMQAQELNATDFVTKPFEVQDILALIKEHIA